jgi:hypothetical protein
VIPTVETIAANVLPKLEQIVVDEQNDPLISEKDKLVGPVVLGAAQLLLSVAQSLELIANQHGSTWKRRH